jgi:hypothetical protein
MVGPTGESLYWHPTNQGETACAHALRGKGLLQGDATTHNSAYWLTEDGLHVARELRNEGRS